ncbi:hypothetical protein HY992_01460 [Candidatus Micrarchaeota archaeon]|nr:hypothetical protein [Candidatus Micrarchaeota archaeon]
MSIPEAELILSEITLRDLQLTREVKLAKKSLVRWLALACGLISPKESRKTLIDLLEAMLELQVRDGVDPEVPEVMEKMAGIDAKYREKEKAIRYHLLQLQNAGLLERNKGKYHFAVAPFAEKKDVAASFEHVYKRKTEVSLAKIREAFKQLEHLHGR